MTGYIVSRNWGSAPWGDLYTSTGLRSFRRYFIAQFEFEPSLKIALGVRRPSCAFWVVHWKRRWCEVAETRRSHISLRNSYGTWACMRVGSMNKRWWTRLICIVHSDQEYCKLASLRVTDRLGFMIEMVVQYQYLLVSSLLSWPWGGIPLLSIRRCVFGSLGGLLQRKLPAASLKDSLSSKDNLIETRTKIIVGAMPYSGNVISKNKRSKNE